MAVVDLVMPKLGESIMEATILKWHKKPGDSVQQDETLLEIATDKVDSEVPAANGGILTEVLFKENDVVPIGAVIARIETNAAATAAPQPQAPAAPVQQPQPAADFSVEHEVPYVPQPKPTQLPSGARFYSPLVLNIAQNEGISLSELEQIPGTGAEGRVTKKDILQYVETRGRQNAAPVQQQQAPPQQPQQPVAQTATQPAVPQPAATPTPSAEIVHVQSAGNGYGDNVEIIEMDRMRKLIAKHMVDSKHTSPHVTSFAEADVTHMVLWRDKVKQEFEKRESTKITFTPLFIDCIVRVLKRFPMLNSSLDGDKIIIKKDINIGMATALPTGNLIVPVIRNADYLNLVGLSKAVNSLAASARTNKLRPDDTQGGTFTLTNVGSFGSLMGTPIINQPQVAILAVGAIKKRPVVIETEQGDTIGIRHMMFLSLSYDHRIVDGALGSTFLTEVAKEFENWDQNKTLP
ncbi:dihydrolipoamide acetyltransferase family protein [Deminuibacter soli]|uniref:Dihydrolipoamide acetyltransferase component of pyruvate dehydrogenase complex n=1 Tax=Deminuibacter soli TaxID=2291815 RepID=A0A3E1NIF8_9BACT|nr:dihydrolipoamide acetyltransferase family protein [Deminuibacter soli]RFM27568.1 2-oxo acid dehydrogenase subunit E2 [Deminuibacter soli]